MASPRPFPPFVVSAAAAVLMAALAAPACGVGGNDPLAGRQDHAVICDKGDRRTCDCGGQAGTQACINSGEGFEPCVCGVDVPDGGLPGQGNAPPTGGCGVCEGCCRGATCIPFDAENSNACGKRGQACSACDDGASCDTDTGTCIQGIAGACNHSNCPYGCCSSNGCVTSPNWAQCGAGGASCSTCRLGGAVCENDGTCNNGLIDQQEYFYISVRSVEVQAQTSSGGDWDSFLWGHTAPDPMVCLNYLDTRDGNPVARTACTPSSCNDSTSCSWNRADGLLKYCYPLSTCTLFCSSPMTVCDPVLFSGRALINGDVDIQVQDVDSVNSNDLIGEGPMPPTRALTGAQYTTGGFGGVVQVQYEILYTLP